MSCQHHDFPSEELASLSVQEPVSPRLVKGYSPEGNWPALFHFSLFFYFLLFVCCTYSGVYNNNKNNNNNNNNNARSPHVGGEILHATKNSTSSHAREYESTDRKRVDTEEYGLLRADAWTLQIEPAWGHHRSAERF